MLKIVTMAALLAISAFAQQPRNVSSYPIGSLKIVPLVIVGEGWSQKIILNNVDKVPVVGTLQFYTKDGQPWPVQLTSGSGSSFLVSIAPGATAIYETVVKQDPQVLGWAIIDQTSTSGDTIGQTVFRKQAPGRADLMTSMVLGDQGYDYFSVHFDNTSGNFTGLGILTSEVCSYSYCQDDQEYTVTITDLNANVIAKKTILQKSGRLYWMNLATDFPETSGKAGTFKVEPGEDAYSSLTGFSLQFAGNGTFTAITPYEY